VIPCIVISTSILVYLLIIKSKLFYGEIFMEITYIEKFTKNT
jgi:hypothetical protein